MGKVAFNLAMLLLVLISFSLLIVKRGSAEFIVALIALSISLAFLGLVVWDVKRQVKASVPAKKLFQPANPTIHTIETLPPVHFRYGLNIIFLS